MVQDNVRTPFPTIYYRPLQPKSGHIIFFDWDGDSISDHVGIVEKVEKDVIYTIEGNSGDQVARQQYQKNSSYIIGYGTP